MVEPLSTPRLEGVSQLINLLMIISPCAQYIAILFVNINHMYLELGNPGSAG
jgi:hypothetical protein